MFNIKIFEKDGVTLKKTVEIRKLERFWQFYWKVNEWYSFLKISLALPVTDFSISISDFVEVNYKNNFSLNKIYRWSVINIDKEYTNNSETLTINVMGISGLMSEILTNDTYTNTASNIIIDLANNFNTEYWFNILDTSEVETTVWNINIDFSWYKNYLQAMREVAEISWKSLFINLDGKVYFKDKLNFTKHFLTLWKDVDELKINEDGKELVNSLILAYNGWVKTYTDSASITDFWKRELYLSKTTELWNLATADIFWNNYIARYKDKIKKISLQVNNEYNYFDIKAGDIISLRNSLYEIKDLQVAKIQYWLERASIDLELSYSLANEIFSKN